MRSSCFLLFDSRTVVARSGCMESNRQGRPSYDNKLKPTTARCLMIRCRGIRL